MRSSLLRGGLAVALVAAALTAALPRSHAQLLRLDASPAQRLDTLPGGVVRLDDYRAPDGYYAFWPVTPAGQDVYSRDSLGLTVFSHGYACLNPVTYGAWLRHLVVDKRQVVLYPRYQRNWVLPGSKAFAKTHNAGLRAAHAALDTLGLPLSHDGPVYIGHSYGAVLTAYLLAYQDSLGYAPAFGALLAAPGTNRLRGSRLDSYAGIDPATQVIVVEEADDAVVGDEFSQLFYGSLPEGARVALLRHEGAEHGEEFLSAGHSECYAHDETFDTRRHRLKAAHTRGMSREDATDRDLYWALADELIDARRERRLHRVFRTPEEGYAWGAWPDGEARPTLATSLRYRAEPLAPVYRYGRPTVLDFLSEPHDLLPPPKDVVVPYSLEEMLARLSVPTEGAAASGERRPLAKEPASSQAPSPPLAPAEAEGPAPR